MGASREKTNAPARRARQALAANARPRADVRIRAFERRIMELTDELRHRTEDIIPLTARVAKLEEHDHERSRTAIVTAPPEAGRHGADAPEPSAELPAGWLGD
jgi:hypothetical protein